ncbi:tyrosine-type recombinase/integrase [Lysobacter capsici]|uniref:tyrosine-type recombinase/integrase n=1 Tax=Lysobacter capsici TaxID=435897 RepID=UPI00177C4C0E|nr:tyrosine-type recombinase/integrase [Lysobacter capsici]UOF16429.1 tyrosine-type recombinase/integrase [Lysobacter capsici]
MGRRRKKNTHLPLGIRLRCGTYWYVRGSAPWVKLGREFGPALIKYAAIVGQKPEVRTVQQAIAHYIEWATTRKKPITKSTLEGYQISTSNLVPVFGHVDLSDVEPSDIYRYLIERGDVQANRDRALLSAAFSHARRVGAFKGEDPTKKLQFRNDEQPRQRYIHDGELAVLLNAASPKLSCMLNFSYLTGLRQSDVVKVKLSDISVDEGIYAVTKKTSTPVLIEWSDELRACVAQANQLWTRKGREYLFESAPRGKHAKRGPGPYTPGGVRALWRVARDKTSVKDVRLNDLRRKAGSDKDTDEQAADLLAHKDSKVTRKHYRAKPKRAQPAR